MVTIFTSCIKTTSIKLRHGKTWYLTAVVQHASISFIRLPLKENGLDPDEVYLEDERQRKQSMRLHGAKRSGFDECVLELPSISELRCRACRRKYCRKHCIGTFDQV